MKIFGNFYKFLKLYYLGNTSQRETKMIPRRNYELKHNTTVAYLKNIPEDVEITTLGRGFGGINIKYDGNSKACTCTEYDAEAAIPEQEIGNIHFNTPSWNIKVGGLVFDIYFCNSADSWHVNCR